PGARGNLYGRINRAPALRCRRGPAPGSEDGSENLGRPRHGATRAPARQRTRVRAATRTVGTAGRGPAAGRTYQPDHVGRSRRIAAGEEACERARWTGRPGPGAAVRAVAAGQRVRRAHVAVGAGERRGTAAPG